MPTPLAGIGSFTIVDGANVTQADLGNNFFVDEDCLGKSRAASVTQMLQELNEHVAGSYVAEDISQVLDSHVHCGVHSLSLLQRLHAPLPSINHTGLD